MNHGVVWGKKEEEVKDPKWGAWLVSESLPQGDDHG